MSRDAKVALITCVAIFVVSIEGLMVPVALPAVEDSFPGTAQTTLSWMITGYAIVMAALVVAMGRIGDRTGRLRVFRGGLLCWVVGAVVTASALHPAQLLAGRGLQGAGHAMLTPSSLGLLLAAWPPSKHGQALALWIVTGSTAGALGPTLGAVVVDGPGWRIAFLMSSVAGLAALMPAKRVLVDTQRKERASLPDLVGSGILAVVLAAVTLVVVQVRAWGLSDPRILGALAVAGVLAPLFWARTRRHPAPVVDPELLRLPTYRLAVGTAALFAMVLFANLYLTTKLFAEVWGWSVLRAGLALAPFPVFASIGALVAERLARRHGQRAILLGALGMMTAGTLWFGLTVDDEPDYFTACLPALLLTGAGGWGAVLTVFNALAVGEMHESNYGIGTAVLATVRQVGGLLGVSLVFGFLSSADAGQPGLGDRYGRAWLLLAAGTVVVTALCTRFPARATTPAAIPEPAAG